MYVVSKSDGPDRFMEVFVRRVHASDLALLTKKDFHFKWKAFSDTELWKVCLTETGEILGAMSLTYEPEEYRVEINLIAARKDCVGRKKRYDRVAGCLIAWACELSAREFGVLACVSLKPKTRLIRYYNTKYQMVKAGHRMFLDGPELITVKKTYLDDED